MCKTDLYGFGVMVAQLVLTQLEEVQVFQPVPQASLRVTAYVKHGEHSVSQNSLLKNKLLDTTGKDGRTYEGESLIVRCGYGGRNMRIKSKRQFERLIRRYAGGSSSVATSPESVTTVAGAEENAGTDTVTKENNSSIDTTQQQDKQQPFKAFASQADYDRAIQQAIKSHEENLKTKLTPEIRKQLEKEANMTAEQKFQEKLNKLEADTKALAIEKSRIKAESIFAAKGISEEDRAAMLDSIACEDAEETEKRANALVAAIEKATNEKIKAAMKKVGVPNSTAGTNAGTEKESIGKILGKEMSQASKTGQKALDYYSLGGNK